MQGGFDSFRGSSEPLPVLKMYFVCGICRIKPDSGDLLAVGNVLEQSEATQSYVCAVRPGFLPHRAHNRFHEETGIPFESAHLFGKTENPARLRCS